MTTPEILAELESLGTEQNRKVYGRHGVRGEIYGVSYANLDKLAKRLRKTATPELVDDLWASGIHDAGVLATKIVQPADLSQAMADRWIQGLDCGVLASAFANALGRSGWTGAAQTAERWLKAPVKTRHWTAFTGWCLVAALASFDESLPEAWFAPLLKRIETELPGSPNLIRQAMNEALIAIGGRTLSLRRGAEAVARKIGPVEVDHGETSCKTPQAIPYLEKIWAHKNQMAARKGTKAK